MTYQIQWACERDSVTRNQHLFWFGFVGDTDPAPAHCSSALLFYLSIIIIIPAHQHVTRLASYAALFLFYLLSPKSCPYLQKLAKHFLNERRSMDTIGVMSGTGLGSLAFLTRHEADCQVDIGETTIHTQSVTILSHHSKEIWSRSSKQFYISGSQWTCLLSKLNKMTF